MSARRETRLFFGRFRGQCFVVPSEEATGINDNFKPVRRHKPPRLAVTSGGAQPEPKACFCGCESVNVDAVNLLGARLGPFFCFCQKCGKEGPAATTYDLAISAWNARPGERAKVAPKKRPAATEKAATKASLPKLAPPTAASKPYSYYQELIALSERPGGLDVG